MTTAIPLKLVHRCSHMCSYQLVLTLRSAGTPTGSSIVMAAGECIIRAHEKTLLVQYGGHMVVT